jgi:16S rRNA processing protein RimM
MSIRLALKYSKSSSQLHIPHVFHLSRKRLPPLIKSHALDTTATDNVSHSLSTDDSPTDLVEIGLIRSSHGVYGEMKVEPLTDFPEERLGEPGPRWLQSPKKPKFKTKSLSSPHQPVTLEYGRTTISKGNEVWIVKLEEINSPEEVSTLKGYTILIPKASRPQLEDEDEFYSTDLVGMSVSLLHGGGGGEEEIGVVMDIFDGTGTHDVLRIKMNTGSSNSEEVEEEQEHGQQEREQEQEEEKYVLLPFAKEFVPEIDLNLRRMTITPPEGLLELAAPIQKRERRQENAGKRERRKSKTKKTVTAAAAAAEGGGGGGG